MSDPAPEDLQDSQAAPASPGAPDQLLHQAQGDLSPQVTSVFTQNILQELYQIIFRFLQSPDQPEAQPLIQRFCLRQNIEENIIPGLETEEKITAEVNQFLLSNN